MMQIFIFLTILSLSISFRQLSIPFKRSIRLNGLVEVGNINEIPNGERKIIDVDQNTIIVANIDGNYYAVNAKCPHLGLPMKTGEISSASGTPTITCKFHNSQFSLEDGSCKQWLDNHFTSIYSR